LPLTPAQKTIAESEKRFRVACCGRRFGKSVFFDDFIQSIETSLTSLFASESFGGVEPAIAAHTHTSFDFEFKSGAHGKEAIHGNAFGGVDSESVVLHGCSMVCFWD